MKHLLGHPAASHGGAIDGFLSFLVYFPYRDIAVSVLTNVFPTPTIHSEVIALAVADAALDALSDPSPVVFPGTFPASVQR